jgi:hypothetical protein
VRDFVQGQFPADDGLFDCLLLAQPVSIVIRLTWSDGAAAWTDAVPWPPYYAFTATPAAMVVTSATSPVAFSVDCTVGNRAGAVAPQAGNNIAVYNAAAGAFEQKRILGVTGTGPWALTVDTTNGVSDTTYTPVVGQRVSPWSDSLNSLVPPVIAFLGTMGPGEQFFTFFDPGLRQRRSPPSPRFWPSVITSRLDSSILDLDAIADASIAEGLGQTTLVGAPGTVAYLIELGFLDAFPL